MNTMAGQRLSVSIYQLIDDGYFKSQRTDGSGWDWSWADYQRDWMNDSPFRHAYRCLPLTIVNQTGWWIKNPVGFSATWQGSMAPGNIVFEFDSPDDYWKYTINSQFGEGIITWNTPFLFRTEPVGSRLLIMGPANYFRKNAHPLTAIIESDWMTMSFTMNYKLMTPHEPVRFNHGEPLFQAIPLLSNVCADLEAAEVRYQRLAEVPEMYNAYKEWSTGRAQFHEKKARNEVKGDQWQKDYFQGRDVAGREAATDHMTKVKPPRILVGSAQAPEATNGAPETSSLPSEATSDEAFGQRRRPQSRRRRPEPRSRSLTNGTEAPDQAIANGPATNGQAHETTDEAPSLAAASLVLSACPVNHAAMPNQVLTSQSTSAATTHNGQAAEPARIEKGDPMQDSSQVGDRQALSNGTANGAGQGTAAASQGNQGQPAPKIDDNWRSWIAENLMLDLPPESVYDAMIRGGVDAKEAENEIRMALASPYFRGSEHLRNRLRKRDWLLGTYRRVNRLNPESDIIPRRHRLSRGQFLDEYYSTNRPVIITGMMEDWPALKKWNLDFFAEKFADREIEVQFGRNSGENYEIEREKFLKKVKFGEFVDMIRNAGSTNDFYLTANNNSSNKQAFPELWQDIVQIPEYLTTHDPMNGFFWMGPTGTVTPFHHDLTNNFMAQVMGRKKVKISPSWDIPLMRNEFHVFSRIDGRVTPAQPSPAEFDQPQIIECILNPGEILFLPIGCLHYVEGIEISVTVSFTNFVFNNDFSSSYSTYHHV